MKLKNGIFTAINIYFLKDVDININILISNKIFSGE